MSELTEERGWTLRARDGVRLHVRELGPPASESVVVLIHGYGEHGGRYVLRLAPLVAAGFRVVLPDMRGHGKSDGVRGHVLQYDDYVADVERLLDRLGCPREAVQLVGHSNGGLIALRYLLTRPAAVHRAAVISPLLGIAVQAPRWKVLAGRASSRLLPQVSVPTEINPAHLSHDQAVVDDYSRDPLNHFVVNTRWYTEAEAAMSACFAEAGQLQVPLLVLRAGGDRIVDSGAVARWCGVAPEGLVTAEEVPGAYHEVLFELDGDRHVSRLCTWLEGGR